jgi:hypothetical protein
MNDVYIFFVLSYLIRNHEKNYIQNELIQLQKQNFVLCRMLLHHIPRVGKCEHIAYEDGDKLKAIGYLCFFFFFLPPREHFIPLNTPLIHILTLPLCNPHL